MWNAKVRCIKDNGSSFNIGEIAFIKNGILAHRKLLDNVKCNSLDELNNKLMAQFELVSEELPEPHKSLLKDGDYVVDRYGTEYIVSLKFGMFIDQHGNVRIISYFDDYLNHINLEKVRIKEHYRDNVLIAKRKERTEQELRKEAILKKIDELKAELETL